MITRSSDEASSASIEKDDGGMASDKRIRVQITEEDLLCVNGCGFYGTPQWKGRCSKCWRTYQVEQKKLEDFTKNRELLSFEKFEGRRKLSTESRTLTLKSLLRKSPSMTTNSDLAGHTPTGPSPATSFPSISRRHRRLSEESQTAQDHFTQFLKKYLPSVSAHEVKRQTYHAVEKIIEQPDVDMDDMSSLIQHFYQVLSDRLLQEEAMNDPSVHVTMEEVMEEVEQYICIRAYSTLFCARADEEVADLSLQDRIRSLHWVTAGFLETKLDFSQKLIRDKLDEAVTEVIDINSHRTASEKLACLIRCSKRIFEALKESRLGAPASADEYLPVLIYVILKGNPPLIQSNVKFISRFALPSRIMSGESGYYFTNLSCALQFIQNMNAESLKMPCEEFEAYTSGRQAPPLNEISCGCNQYVIKKEFSSERQPFISFSSGFIDRWSGYFSQAIRSMESSLSEVRKLLERQRLLSSRIEDFESRIIRENDKYLSDIRDFANAYPSEQLRHLTEQLAVDEALVFSNSASLSTCESSRTSQDRDDDEVFNSVIASFVENRAMMITDSDLSDAVEIAVNDLVIPSDSKENIMAKPVHSIPEEI